MTQKQSLPQRSASDIDDDDADMYAALWAAAPFPRLPDDAPVEFKELMITIDDPRRVYTIHKAARRHQFNILVERFTNQVRFGCQSPKCHTKTCFSNRVRIARGAPVRRYNATSARTLATYMASQDNPEHALCPHFREESFISRKSVKVPPGFHTGRDGSPRAADGGTHSADLGQRESVINQSACQSALYGNQGPSQSKSMPHHTTTTRLSTNSSVAGDWEEPSKTDHKSFVQAVFGTTAFKMVEWLAPRNLQKSTKSTEYAMQSADREAATFEPPDRLQNSDEIASDARPRSSSKSSQSLAISEKSEIANIRETLESVPSQPRQRTPIKSSSTSYSTTPEEKPPLARKSSHLRTSSENMDHSPRTNMTNQPRKLTDNEIHLFPNLKATKQHIVRQALIQSSPVRTAEPTIEFVKTPKGHREAIPRSPNQPKGPAVAPIEDVARALRPIQKPTTSEIQASKHSERQSPQSLSHLPPEIILSICDIFSAYDLNEDSDLLSIKNGQTEDECVLDSGKACLYKQPSLVDPSIRLQWLNFGEQCLFDTLSRPGSLLQSLRKDGKLMDSMSVWCFMLRLTRAAPSLVFDSLWRAAGALFKPPDILTKIYDWAPTRSSELGWQDALSDEDAAHIISICMHTLVAATPFVQDSRQLMNMSRTRSTGSSMLGRDFAMPEAARLCMRYNDAFSTDHALRLARRMFAAIPNRRSFAELMRPHLNIKNDTQTPKDILHLVMETLKEDISLLSLPTFHTGEVAMHELRTTILVLDWARTVMMQDWTGTAEVPSHGSFGGALLTFSTIYEQRKTLLLGDIHFQTPYFADRIDLVTTAREWTRYIPTSRTLHLFDYPFLFNPETLVTCFRAINYARMNEAYEKSKSSSGMMSAAVSPHNLMVDRVRRQRLAEQMRVANSTSLVLEIRRSHVLLDAFNSIWRREEREMLRPIKLRLGEDSGEEGMDLGGVQQEFFGLAMAEALDPDYGTFTVDARTRMTWFQPGSPEPLWKFELIGTIVSLAVYNGLTLPITFPKALYRRLLDQEVTELHHIQDGWPDLAAGLTTLLEWNIVDGNIEDIFARTYEFSVSQFGQNVSRDMSASDSWPQFPDITESANPDDASMVTDTNRNQYVSDYIRWLTDVSVRPQFEAFKRGFFTCITPRSITLFDAATLQSLVEGEQRIDVSELRRVARYQGWDASHRAVRDFWSVVKKFDLDQKRKLLEFVTATDRVPVGGMRNMQFTLQKNGQDDVHLPTSATCFGILLLPEYSSKEVMKEKLLTALENSKGFGQM